MKLIFLLYVFLTIVISGCASQGGPERTREALSCPPDEYIVCRGGTVSRIGNTERRDPQFCRCEPRLQD